MRIGRKRANSGLAVHLEISGDTCAANRPVNVTAKTEGAITKRCRSCWTPARTAIARVLVEAARTANAKRTEHHHRIVMDKIEVGARLDDLFAWFLTDDEKAYVDELVARYHAPVEPVEVFTSVGRSGAVFAAKAADDLISLIPAEPQRTAFAEAAIRAGARLDRPRKPVRGKSRNVLAKIHNSFVTPKTQAA